MKKMTLSCALATLCLPLSLADVYAQNLSIRKAYLQAALSSHPDRKGDNHSMSQVNEAYQILKAHIKAYEYKDRVTKEYVSRFYANNEGHPLFDAGVPALKSVPALLREAFDIRDTFDSMPSLMLLTDRSMSNRSQNSIYFQHEGDDYQIVWFGGRSIDSFLIQCISNGGRTGKSCFKLKFYVENWYGTTLANSEEQIFNLLAILFQSSPYSDGNVQADDEERFSWGRVYHDVLSAINDAIDISDCEKKAELFGHELIKRSGRFDQDKWEVRLAGVVLNVYLREEQAISIFNPFDLEYYKPLKALPTKFKATDLIKVLANGQFKRLKRHYLHSDDYAGDADVDCHRGFIDNPFLVLKTWIEERGCVNEKRVGYDERKIDEVKINFGFGHHDLSSLIVELDNSYPLIDLAEIATEVFEQNLLSA